MYIIMQYNYINYIANHFQRSMTMKTYGMQKDCYDMDSNFPDDDFSNRKNEYGDADLSMGFIDNFANMKLDSISIVDCTMRSIVSDEDEFIGAQVNVMKKEDVIYYTHINTEQDQYRKEQDNCLGFLETFNNLNNSSLRGNSSIDSTPIKEDIIEFDIEVGENNCDDKENGDESLLAMSSSGILALYDDDENDTPHSSRHGRYTMETVAKHNSTYDNWLVINNSVYDVTNWLLKHPGGGRILGHYAGSDCTVRVFIEYVSWSNSMLNNCVMGLVLSCYLCSLPFTIY